MRTSTNGIELIKSFEGCKLTAYYDAVGVLTIGYGHTSGVKEGDKITQKKADELLVGDLLRFETRVNYWSEKKYFFNQNEFDALVSFAYNCGNGNLDGLLKNGRNSRGQIADDILLYNKAGGKMLTGLAKRRQKERTLFLSPVEIVSNNTPKTNDEIAREVMEGKWGNGDERKKGLKDAGYNPTTIQKLVNELTKEHNREIAFEVIAGQWGNGEERKKRLKDAGYNPTTIQKLVNELI